MSANLSRESELPMMIATTLDAINILTAAAQRSLKAGDPSICRTWTWHAVAKLERDIRAELMPTEVKHIEQVTSTPS